MSLTITRLRREYEIRLWRKIIEDNPYVAVVETTGGRAWGRKNMRARILGEHLKDGLVGTRYAVPRSAREGAMRSRFKQLATLFRTGGSAVVYGKQIDPVVQVVKRAQDVIDGSLLVGGRFGGRVVTAPVWQRALDSEGEAAEWTQLLSVLAKPPGVIQILDQQSKGLVQVLRQGGRAQQLTGILQRMEESPKSG